MYVPRALVHQREFEAAIGRAARALKPHVVRIVSSLGEDWSGEPAVFFTVILADAAFRGDRLGSIANKVSWDVVQRIQPLEQWGVLPYFDFRSQSEQAKLDRLVTA